MKTMIVGAFLLCCTGRCLADAVPTKEAEPVKLAEPATVCRNDGGNADVEGYAFPEQFGGTKVDSCVQLKPTERSDTYLVFVSAKREGPFNESGKIFLNARRTTVDKTLSASLGDFTPSKGVNEALSSKLIMEVSEAGVTIIKIYPRYEKKKLADAGIDVALWIPHVTVRRTFQTDPGIK